MATQGQSQTDGLQELSLFAESEDTYASTVYTWSITMLSDTVGLKGVKMRYCATEGQKHELQDRAP